MQMPDRVIVHLTLCRKKEVSGGRNRGIEGGKVEPEMEGVMCRFLVLGGV